MERLFDDCKLYEWPTRLNKVVGRAVDKGASPEAEVLASLAVVVSTTTEHNGYAAFLHMEGSALNIARAARRIGQSLWRKNPLAVLALMAGVQDEARKELGSMMERWKEEGRLFQREGDEPNPFLDQLEDELAYNAYRKARRAGVTHEQLVALDHSNAKYLDRYTEEQG